MASQRRLRRWFQLSEHSGLPTRHEFCQRRGRSGAITGIIYDSQPLFELPLRQPLSRKSDFEPSTSERSTLRMTPSVISSSRHWPDWRNRSRRHSDGQAVPKRQDQTRDFGALQPPATDFFCSFNYLVATAPRESHMTYARNFLAFSLIFVHCVYAQSPSSDEPARSVVLQKDERSGPAR